MPNLMLVPPKSMPRVVGWSMSQLSLGKVIKTSSDLRRTLVRNSVFPAWNLLLSDDGGARSPNLLQRQARQKIRLDLLERHTFRLRNEDDKENDEDYVQRAIKEKRITVAEAREEQQECHTHDGVGDPVCRGTKCHPEVAGCKWINFRAKHPNDRPGAHSKTNNKDEQRKDCEIAKLRVLFDPHVEERSDSNHGRAHSDKTCIHDRLAT